MMLKRSSRTLELGSNRGDKSHVEAYIHKGGFMASLFTRIVLIASEAGPKDGFNVIQIYIARR